MERWLQPASSFSKAEPQGSAFFVAADICTDRSGSLRGAMSRTGGFKPKTEIQPQISQIDTDFEEVVKSIVNPVWWKS
jgi:hypothetical protein